MTTADLATRRHSDDAVGVGARRPPRPIRSGGWPKGAWVRACIAAETLGMTAAAAAAQLAGELPGTWQYRAAAALAVVVVGGLVEGTALGVLQGRVMGAVLAPSERPVHRRWAAVTVLVAGLGWAAASAPAALADPDTSTTPPPLSLVMLSAAALGAAMGALLGLAQAWAMKDAVNRPYRWVWVSAVAWTPAMVVIFTGATTPAESWPIPFIVLVGTLTGLVAGTVLGVVSGSLLGVLDSPAPRPGHLRSAAQRAPWAAAALAGAAAALGLLVPDVYPDVAGTDAMLRGYDLLTFAVVVPGLVASLLAQQRSGGHVLAQLGEVSLLAYLVYTYAYYVLGTGFADLLLLHVAVLTTSLTALVLALGRLDVAGVAHAFGPRTRVRTAAVVLGTLSVALGAMWVYYSVHSARTGEVPPGSALVETDLVVHLGVVLDLTLLVPLYAAAAILLWRRSPWGYVLGVLTLASGLLHQISYVVALIAQDAAAVPGAVPFDPAEPVIVLLYTAALLALVTGLRQTTSSHDR